MRPLLLLFAAALLAVAPQFATAQVLSPWSVEQASARSSVSFLSVPEGKVLPIDQAPFDLAIPQPGAKDLVVELARTEVMPASLAARFPEIATYRGYTVDGELVAITEDPTGISVFVNDKDGAWQIEPVDVGVARLGLTETLTGAAGNIPLSCGYIDEDHEAPSGSVASQATSPDVSAREQVQRRVYVLALACTGEYGRSKGGTKASVMASYNTAMNVLNGITLPEAALEFRLHPDNDTLIFVNSSTDPYIETNSGRALLGENPPVINSRIDINSYDLGHVFTNGCNDVGGVVSGRACNNAGKARGVTCHSSGNVAGIVRSIMAHEVAHQFAVSHSWNNCPGNDGQRAGEGAYEPGSGSTIMSYQRACGSTNNISGPDGIYYHVGSLQQFADFVVRGGACADFEAVNNETPEISWPYTNGFAIPKSTPFILSATATDPDGDDLRYNWEQYDLGPAFTLCTQRESGPLFRSNDPSRNGNTRYFPEQQTVIENATDCEELLPNQAREMNFRMTVRDNNRDGGGTVWEQVTFDVTEEGPFAVTTQTSLAEVYPAGSLVNVSWDVANTNQAPVNTEFVNILLSMDNGRTFPYVLVDGTLNDGSEDVTLPVVDGSQARIKVEAVGNIYYALSPSRFTIIEPTAPGFTFVPSQTTAFLCLPEVGEIDFFTSSLLDYDSTLTVRIANQLPAGVNASLETNSLVPGDATKLTVDFADFNATDSVRVVIEAFGPDVDTARREILFDVVSNDFSDLQLSFPSNGAESVAGAATFSYQPSTRARQHLLQVSTDPTFNRGSLEIDNPDPSGNQLSTLLEPNTVYFWRVLPSNRCGITYDVPVNAFHTFAASCVTFEQTESILIPPSVRRTVQASIPIAESGQVNDLNVPLVNISHTDIRGLEVRLVSPAGTSARLVSGRCGGLSRLISGFDDEALFALSCNPPPTDGSTRLPTDALSVFNGEDIQGEWNLEVEVLNPSSSGGEFRAFEVEFCADIVSRPPTLELDLVTVPTNGFQYLNREFVRAEDPDNTEDELTFIVVTEPTRGHLEFFGGQIGIGNRFVMKDLGANFVTYVDDSGTPGADSMTIVLTDRSGNLIATPTINFNTDDNFSTSTGSAQFGEVAMTLAPNPSTDQTLLRFGSPSEGGELLVTDARGSLVTRIAIAAGANVQTLDVAEYARGIYNVHYRGNDGLQTLRLVVQ